AEKVKTEPRRERRAGRAKLKEELEPIIMRVLRSPVGQRVVIDQVLRIELPGAVAEPSRAIPCLAPEFESDLIGVNVLEERDDQARDDERRQRSPAPARPYAKNHRRAPRQ